MLKGYAGRYLHIDLSSGEIHKKKVEADLMEHFLGGSGISTKILWDKCRGLKDPFSPKNFLIFATGPLTGSFWPSSGRTVVSAISPLTGMYGDSNSGGAFAPALKKAGYDYLIIEGKSSIPQYLLIKDDLIQLKDARKLWDTGNFETQANIMSTQGNKEMQIASIGPAGSNMIKFSNIYFTGGRSASRCGLGAVMGSKNLKAIAIAPTKNNYTISFFRQSLLCLSGQRKFLQPLKILIHFIDHIRFWKLLAKPFGLTFSSLLLRRKIMSNSVVKNLREDGTALLVTEMSEIGRMPTKNFQSGCFEDYEKISAKNLKPFIIKKYSGCYGCPIMCGKNYETDEATTKNLEYETICSMGSKCGNNNLKSIIEANTLCNDLGMDTISAGGVISFIMELYEQKILKKELIDDIGGNTTPTWGNHKFILQALEKIARRSGKTDILAEGVRRLADYLGDNTSQFAMHVKGMEIPAQDGRAQKSMALAQAVSSRGADHLKAFPTIEELDYGHLMKKIDYAKEWSKGELSHLRNRTSEDQKAFLIKNGEDMCSVIDSIGICKFGSIFPPIIYWDELLKGINLATNFNYHLIDDIKKIGERICNLQRMLNLTLGLKKEDDTLPTRFLREKSPCKGDASGKTVNLNYMITDYYKQRGWDTESGIPLNETLSRLGLLETIK